jgi:UDP:flavonoid glycosyltransferase YjiC (YdhE family)
VPGYWFIEPPPGWEAPAELVKFLDAGPPPVSVGFGSMMGHNPRATIQTVVRALLLSGQRGVLLTGWAGTHTDTHLPHTVYCAEGLPHSWLFPRMAAVVHHGGAGTTGAGLRSGVPSIITPLAADQYAWATRAHTLGVSPNPIPFTELSAEGLASAIDQAVHDTTMRARAADLARHIAAEDGISRAVGIITNHLARQASG